MKTWIRKALGVSDGESTEVKGLTAAMTLLAKEVVRMADNILQLRKDVNLLAEHTRVHQLAIQQIHANQTEMVSSSKKSSLDISMPSPKTTNENKPN